MEEGILERVVEESEICITQSSPLVKKIMKVLIAYQLYKALSCK